MTALNVTRVVDGKKVVQKISRKPQKSKAYFVKSIISQLNDALVRDARVLSKLNQRKKFGKALQNRICQRSRWRRTRLDQVYAV